MSLSIDHKQIALVNLNGGIDILKVLHEAPWIKHDRHYEIELTAPPERNYIVPIGYLDGDTVVTGSIRGRVLLWHLDKDTHTWIEQGAQVPFLLRRIPSDCFAPSGDSLMIRTLAVGPRS